MNLRSARSPFSLLVGRCAGIRRYAATLCAALLLLGCGSSAKGPSTPTLPPADPRAVTQLAKGVQAAEDPNAAEQAIEHFEAAIKADDKLWEARYNLGVMLARRGELDAAEKHLAQAAELAPNAEDVLVALSEVRRRQGDGDGAVEALRPFVTRYPDAIVARTQLVSALRENGKLDEAIAEAQEVLVRRAGDPNALSELALAHLDKEEVDTAELLSKEALKAKDRSAIAERTAGMIALKRGDDAVAFQHFVRASELDPTDTTARLNMGAVLVEAGVYDQAEKHYSAVLDERPGDVDAMLGLAAALRGQGSRERQQPYQRAESLLKQVLQQKPKHLAATFNLAVLYADFLERPAEARPLFKKFLDLSPSDHSGRALAEKALAAK